MVIIFKCTTLPIFFQLVLNFMKHICYYCNEIATTKEHTPPKCFFPKKKDLPSGSPDYRKNLITVPSCEKHNTGRSKDDEYTAVSIIMHSDNSDLAFSLLMSKWIDVLVRQNASLGKLIFSRSTPVVVPYMHGDLLIPGKTLAIAYERERIDQVIKSIAYALYYHESNYKDKWKGECIIKSPKFLTPDLSLNPEHDYLVRASQAFNELGLEKKGGHPNIFYYQIHKFKDKGWAIKMVFYQSIIFFALPCSPASKLII